jgi:hypothetical protein
MHEGLKEWVMSSHERSYARMRGEVVCAGATDMATPIPYKS